jgi:hypothetical protein
MKYLLVVRCDLFSYVDLFPTDIPTAHHTAESVGVGTRGERRTRRCEKERDL